MFKIWFVFVRFCSGFVWGGGFWCGGFSDWWIGDIEGVFIWGIVISDGGFGIDFDVYGYIIMYMFRNI